MEKEKVSEKTGVSKNKKEGKRKCFTNRAVSQKLEIEYEKIFLDASEGIIVVDIKTKQILSVNFAACKVFKYTKKEFKQLKTMALHPKKALDRITPEFESTSRSEKIFLYNVPCLCKDNTIFYANISAILMNLGGHKCNVGFFTDNTENMLMMDELRNSEKRYRDLCIIDDLTHLYNSRHFYSQLKMEVERANRYRQSLTIFLIDIDSFKAFNDMHGHIEGDLVLRRFGKVVKRCLRKTDSAYRYGGEEFMVILPITTKKDGLVTAERIRKEFENEIFSLNDKKNVHVTVSIGVAQYNVSENIKDFIQRVDMFMYEAKRQGKNRVVSH